MLNLKQVSESTAVVLERPPHSVNVGSIPLPGHTKNVKKTIDYFPAKHLHERDCVKKKRTVSLVALLGDG